MQVARNVYLSTEKTFTRKLYEILLAFKLESLLTKDQILEIYMNQIYLGHRAYGFAAASETYFGKPLKDITSPRPRCWPACRRRRRPTTRSPTRARARAPAVHHRPHARERLHHAPSSARPRKARSCSCRAPTDVAGARRIRGRDGAPADVRAVRRRGLHARPQGLPTLDRGRPGRRLPRAAQGHHGLRAAPDLPRPGGLRRPAGRPARSSTRASTTRWPTTPTTAT